MANLMNDNFATVGAKLSCSYPVSDEYLLPRNPPTFILLHVSRNTVLTHLLELNASRACGIDGLMARLLKDAGQGIVIPLTHIFILSIETNTFPDCWKTTIVSPLYKDGDRAAANISINLLACYLSLVYYLGKQYMNRCMDF